MRKPETNMDRFDGLVWKVMERLTEACPLPISLPPEDFDLRPGEQTSDGDYKQSKDEEFLRLTLCWLKDEGFIRGDNRYVITLKGLENCAAVPASLKSPSA